MNTALRLFWMVLLIAGIGLAQTPGPVPQPSKAAAPKPWEFSISVSGYLVPKEIDYGSPVFTADHNWLHLEARYNYENQQTGSLWAGYNFSAGKTVKFSATPIFGAVFGRTTGVAPGCELSLGYKRIELSSEIEYVVDTGDRTQNFLYSWNEFVYSPTDWFHAGLVAQRTRAYQTSLDVQRGFSVGVAHNHADFTVYTFNAGWTDPTVVLALSYAF
jgi:hypothetical protein